MKGGGCERSGRASTHYSHSRMVVERVEALASDTLEQADEGRSVLLASSAADNKKRARTVAAAVRARSRLRVFRPAMQRQQWEGGGPAQLARGSTLLVMMGVEGIKYCLSFYSTASIVSIDRFVFSASYWGA